MQIIEVHAGRLGYEDSGSGETIVLVHGAVMDTSVWDDVVEDLERFCSCVRTLGMTPLL